MTKAEQELVDFVLTPEFAETLPATTGPLRRLGEMRLAVARERVPEGYEAELADAQAELAAAQARVNELGRKHPAAAFGPEGIIAKLGARG